MNLKSLIIMVVLLNSAISKADFIDIQIDTPNSGDTTYIYHSSVGEQTTSDNLISQTFNDGSWTGTQFPNSSDLDEAEIITGKHGAYAETTISSVGLLTENEIKLGFTSNFNSDIRWWNNQESTVTMSQTAIDNLGNSTTQSTLLVDTTNHNYEYNNYGNTLIIAPDENLTHGTLTARYDFNIIGNAKYNGGFAGVDIRNPELKITHTTLTTTTNTVVEFCWEKTPTTCPAEEQIEELNTVIETIEDDLMDIIETIDQPEIEIVDTYIDYEEIEIAEIEYIPDDVVVEMEAMFEEIIIQDELPIVEEEIVIAEVMTEEIIEAEEITTEDIIEEFVAIEEEIIEEPVEIAEEVIEEEPVEIIEEEIAEEEVVEETIEVAEAEEEVIEEEVVEEEVIEKDTMEIKKAQLEEIINEKDLEQVQKVSITLEAINILVSREIIAKAVDISSFQNFNSQALFTAVAMPSGVNIKNNSLPASYFNNAYEDTVLLASMVSNDPLASHDIAVNQAVNETNKKLAIYRRLLNAKSN